jgi:hypothetical protein
VLVRRSAPLTLPSPPAAGGEGWVRGAVPIRLNSNNFAFIGTAEGAGPHARPQSCPALTNLMVLVGTICNSQEARQSCLAPTDEPTNPVGSRCEQAFLTKKGNNR